MISKAMTKRIEKMVTEDYQNRSDGYPKSDIPVFINTWVRHGIQVLEVEFKNTDEGVAIKETQRILRENKVGNKQTTVNAYQNGDYHNDWVMVVVEFWSKK